MKAEQLIYYFKLLLFATAWVSPKWSNKIYPSLGGVYQMFSFCGTKEYLRRKFPFFHVRKHSRENGFCLKEEQINMVHG